MASCSQAVNEVFGGNFGVTRHINLNTDYNPARNIYECIMFGSELDMLEKHLETMFLSWIGSSSEATVTHAGVHKPSTL
jgi:hypothetical protein